MIQTHEELRTAIAEIVDDAIGDPGYGFDNAAGDGVTERHAQYVTAILALIPEAPAPTWIACSEAMPNEAMSVWVAYLYHDGTVQVAETEWADHCGLMDFWVPVPDRGGHYYPWPFRVTHWMPRTLPAPPAGEEE
jgi:hypothetical protein